jgi:hypothetical protein
MLKFSVSRKQNQGKEDGPQERLQKGEKDSIEEIEAEKNKGKDNDEGNMFPFHSLFSKESAGATKEESSRMSQGKTVISRLAAGRIFTGINSCEGMNLPSPQPKGQGLLRVNEEADRKKLSSF